MNDNLTENQTQLAQIQSQRQSRVHQKFLQSRQTALREINNLLRLQTAVVAPSIVQPFQREQVVFARRDLEEFALGSLERCFGPEYAVFNGRQVPRIPNGDLLLFDRVLEIEGQRHQLNAPARITTACEVPADAWYFQHNASPFVPLSVLMEMALQPCGFLSAYLGTALSAPDQDFLFRNLDGTATLLTDLDLRGQTVINHASLHSTVSGAGTIIQSFSFCLSCNGVDFYRGELVFGYFPPAVMARQAGLDDQRAPVKLQDQDILPQQAWNVLDESKPSYRLSGGQLNFLDQIQVTKTGGTYGLGMVSAQKTVNPQDWFYSMSFLSGSRHARLAGRGSHPAGHAGVLSGLRFGKRFPLTAFQSPERISECSGNTAGRSPLPITRCKSKCTSRTCSPRQGIRPLWLMPACGRTASAFMRY